MILIKCWFLNFLFHVQQFVIVLFFMFLFIMCGVYVATIFSFSTFVCHLLPSTEMLLIFNAFL